MTAETFCDPLYTKALTELVTRIAQAEAPISFDLATSEILELVGITKSSAKLKTRCDYLIRNTRLPFSTQKLGGEEDEQETKFLWVDPQAINGIFPFYRIPDVGGKPRKASDIPVQEAARAVIDTAAAQYGLPRDSLITETAKTLGFARAASNTDCYKLCDQAVDYAFRYGALNIDDNGFITSADSN